MPITSLNDSLKMNSATGRCTIHLRNNIFLMDKLTDKNSRTWYAQKTIEND